MTDAVSKSLTTLSNERNAAEQFAKISTARTTTTTATATRSEIVGVAPGKDALKDILFGSIAGTAGKIVEYPFDTIKVRLQSQPTTPPFLYSGPWDCFRQSISQSSHGINGASGAAGGGGIGGGIRGLYRGLSAPLFGAAIETSSLFFSYRLAQTLLRSSGFLILPSPSSSSTSDEGDYKKTNVKNDNYNSTPHSNNNNQQHDDDGSRLPLGALVACGAASGAFTSLILTPIELVKCQMQVPPLSPIPPPPTHATTTTINHIPTAVVRRPPPGPLSIIATIYRHHGPLGFWHGQLATCIRETGGSAAWFGVYEAVSALFRSRSLSSSSSSSTTISTTTPTTTTTTTTTTGPPPLAIWQQMTAGACAGVSYIFGFFPADTIKSRMQTDAAVVVVEVGTTKPTSTPAPAPTSGRSVDSKREKKKIGNVKKITFWECARIVWREQGIKGLYRGCGITVARAAPSSAFIFAIYEGLRGAF